MVFVQTEIKDRIGYIILNRPEKRNALNFEVIAELKHAFTEAEENPEVKVIVLKAVGEAFCAGADLEYLQKLQGYNYAENLQDSTHLMELFKKIYTLKKLVIAQVNGHAIAGGCGLASVCDFIFAAEDANFGYTEVRIGFIPAIVMVFLIRKIGETRAKEMLLSGNIYNSNDAKMMGLVNFVMEENKLAGAVEDFATALCKHNSSSSMEMTKQMIADIPGKTLDDALHFAVEMNAKARLTDDCKKGIDSFLKKHKLTW